jgi:hypothetical protein
VNKYTLAIHIKTNKKCLKARGESPIEKLEKELDIKTSKFKNSLLEKENIIIEKDKLLLENKILIAELKAKLSVHENINGSLIENSSSGSTNTNSNNTSNVINNNNNIIVSNLDILENPDKLRMLIEEHYSPDYFKGGQQGVAKFSNDHLITDDRGNKMYICTDVSRNSFKYRNSSGDLIKDPNCSQLVNSMLDNGLKEVAYKHSNSLMDKDIAFQDKAVLMDTYFDIASMDTEATKFSKCLREMNCK